MHVNLDFLAIIFADVIKTSRRRRDDGIIFSCVDRFSHSVTLSDQMHFQIVVVFLVNLNIKSVMLKRFRVRKGSNEGICIRLRFIESAVAVVLVQ